MDDFSNIRGFGQGIDIPFSDVRRTYWQLDSKMVKAPSLLLLLGCQSGLIRADFQAHNINEDIAIGTPLLRVNASDADIRFSVSDDHFAVDSNGVISSNKRMDADGNNGYYEFRVTMTVPVRIYTKNTNDEEPRFSQQV